MAIRRRHNGEVGPWRRISTRHRRLSEVFIGKRLVRLADGFHSDGKGWDGFGIMAQQRVLKLRPVSRDSRTVLPSPQGSMTGRSRRPDLTGPVIATSVQAMAVCRQGRFALTSNGNVGATWPSWQGWRDRA
jgi:hypothetical protein